MSSFAWAQHIHMILITIMEGVPSQLTIGIF